MEEKVTQEQLLHILCVFHDFCSSREIPYSLHGGTLLGAIREKGFIPWDDDADVTMTRADFKRLEAALRGTETNYHIRGHIKKQFCELSDPNVWVDIFICDYISEKHACRKMKQLILTALDTMHRDRESIKLSNLDRYSKSKRMVFKAAYSVGQVIPKSWTEKMYSRVSEKWFLGDRTCLFRSNDQYAGRELIFPSDWLERYQKVPFEDRELSVLTQWDQLLTQCYGADYMTPIQDSRNAEVHNLIRQEKRINL